MKRYSNDLRSRVINVCQTTSDTYRKISKTFSISLGTISRWIREYNHGTLFEFRKRKVKQQRATKHILEYVKNNPFKTLYQIKCHLSKSNIIVSRSTIQRVLKKHKISYKKSYTKIQSPKATVEKKREMKEKLRAINKVYSLDETGIYLENHPFKGWSKVGEKCIYKQAKARSPRSVTMIMTISNTGIENYQIFTKSLNKDRMLEYVETFSQMEGTLLMDNLRIHHCKEVKEKISNKGLDILYNLPYSPELNPIEEVFSVIKNHIRRDMIIGLKSIKEYMPKLINKLNLTLDFNKFYKHAFD